MAGTAAIQPIDGDSITYHTFPTRTAVINTSFNGDQPFDPGVYRSDRFVDRPLVNTRWEFLFNGVDEYENRDINLQSLTDIRFYVYYADFTVF